MGLPFAYSRQIQYPFDVACAKDAVKLQTELRHKFEAFPQETVHIFFGQSVLHQALVGEGYEHGSGSLEGRYLTLAPRRCIDRGSLRISIAGFDEQLPTG